MNNQWQTIWVTFISILAMLMSAYASSSPQMSLHMPETSYSASDSQQQTDCHSMDSGMHHTVVDQSNDSHSQCSTSSGVHLCCTAACSSVHFALMPTSELAPAESSLALHSNIIIGHKVTRLQTLLRPPSA
ncbi:hypothetical protein [Vibrio sp. WXL103]|uniref:hypothetical protein n=1 Tax=Vibrio sp. WXL103 TaxID=3450710 RepID=UPI003EC4C516